MSLMFSILLGSMYWITQILAIGLPNTSLVDPEFYNSVPKFNGYPIIQPVLDIVCLSILALAYYLEKNNKKIVKKN